MLTFAAITPHPPIIIPKIGSKTDLDTAQNTIKAMDELSVEIADADPETIIIISPHAVINPEKMAIYGNPKFRGDLANYNAPNINFEFENDIELASKINIEAKKHNINAFLFGDSSSQYFELDHGEIVPLYYLAKNMSSNVKILPIAYSFLSKSDHYIFGQAIKDAISKTSKNIAVVASGDMSHRLFEKNNVGVKFDKEIVKNIKEKNINAILELDNEFIEEAGECGYRSILILLGILDKLDYKPKILSYEGPFGVGYLVANFKLIKKGVE